MTVTLTAMDPRIQYSWTSNLMLRDSMKMFADESCTFYINARQDPLAFLSMCRNSAGVTMFEAVFFVKGTQRYVTYNEQTMLHEGADVFVSNQRSLSADKLRSFCKLRQVSDDMKEQVNKLPNAKRGALPMSEQAVVEIAFSADYLFLQHYGSPAKAEKVIYQVKNGLSAMYQQLGIRISVVDVYIFDEELTSALISAANDSDTYQNVLIHYYMNRVFYADPTTRVLPRISGIPDAVVTFTARPFHGVRTDKDGESSLLGLAIPNALCQPFSHALIMLPMGYEDPASHYQILSTMATTAAHEIGHLLGLDHHNNTLCGEACYKSEEGDCFMTSVVRHYSGKWSECSQSHIRDVKQNPQNFQKVCMYTWNSQLSYPSTPVYAPKAPHVRVTPSDDPAVTLVTSSTTTAATVTERRPTTRPTTRATTSQTVPVTTKATDAPTTVPATPQETLATQVETSTTSKSSTGTTISVAEENSSGTKTWIIIAVCVLVAVTVAACIIGFIAWKRSGRPVSKSSRSSDHKALVKSPARTTSRPVRKSSGKSRGSQKSKLLK